MLSHNVVNIVLFLLVIYVNNFYLLFPVEGYCAFFQVVNCLLVTFANFILGMSFSDRVLQTVRIQWILIFHMWQAFPSYLCLSLFCLIFFFNLKKLCK